MLKRIKLIERFNGGYMLCRYGDLWISKATAGAKMPRGFRPDGIGLWLVVPRNGKARRFPTLWQALKFADASDLFYPTERGYGDRRELLTVEQVLAEHGETPAELRAYNSAIEAGRNAFKSISGRLADAMRGPRATPTLRAAPSPTRIAPPPGRPATTRWKTRSTPPDQFARRWGVIPGPPSTRPPAYPIPAATFSRRT